MHIADSSALICITLSNLTLSSRAHTCHPERSEGSGLLGSEMLHYAQHARAVPSMPDSSNLRPLNSSPTPNLCLQVLLGRTHKEGSPLSLGSQGDPERARTSDLQIRNLSLYPLSYGIIDWLYEPYVDLRLMYFCLSGSLRLPFFMG